MSDMKAKKFIKDALISHEINDIENALIAFYVDSNNIKVENNKFIKEVIKGQNSHSNLIKQGFAKTKEKIDIYDLVNYFEILVPKSDKKINGAFFTPELITKFIIREVLRDKNNVDNLRVCDPSCGCGAFLIEYAKILKKNFNQSVISTIENNLFGVDIAEYSIRRAKILLTLLALDFGEDKNDIKFNLATGDSLNSDWSNLFNNNKGFDFVISNPPYVKFQDLDKKTREELFNNWETLKTGNYNLYFAFFELGMRLINENGLLGYITPNNYFTSLAGIKLREYLHSNKFIQKIIDFDHLKIFEAQTYTCITFLAKQKQESFKYERIDSYENLKKLDNINFSEVKYSDLNNRKWRLLKEIDSNNIRNIEKLRKLKDLVDIRVGIATCKDELYFIDGNTNENGYYRKNYNNSTYLIEENIVKPIIKISDFKNQEQMDGNQRKIIFPYIKTADKVGIISQEKLKKDFPNCYNYFVAIKDELQTRDKGTVEYPEWYAYARTQGLNFYGEKLTTPTFSSTPRFLYVKAPDTLFCNGYAVYLKKKQDLFTPNAISLKVLAKILNSKVMDYYIKKTSVSIEGGYPCYQKNFIELFGVPNLSESDIKFLEQETNSEKINSFLEDKYNIKL
ncbi:MAG: N-6 DNA methylase [Candidatus Parcubacteria bacterium]|nr:N-6 DNA methylase [Candidatus Parcubacteria bacterium]